MSYFGKNIRKIRTVKKLSQTAFADLFGLNRGNIGAYEEGRSEAKIDTIISIAKYFGISIDSLLTKELTINDIYNFNIFDKKLNNHTSTPENQPAIENLKKQKGIPLVEKEMFSRYINNLKNKDFVFHLPVIKIPGLNGKWRVFEMPGCSMHKGQYGIFDGDWLFCQHKAKTNHHYKEEGIYVIVTQQDIHIGKVVYKKGKITIRSENISYPNKQIEEKQVQEVWEMRSLYSKRKFTGLAVESRLLKLEEEMEKLKKELEQQAK